jgi:hypothetical protein
MLIYNFSREVHPNFEEADIQEGFDSNAAYLTEEDLEEPTPLSKSEDYNTAVERCQVFIGVLKKDLG